MQKHVVYVFMYAYVREETAAKKKEIAEWGKKKNNLVSKQLQQHLTFGRWLCQPPKSATNGNAVLQQELLPLARCRSVQIVKGRGLGGECRVAVWKRLAVESGLRSSANSTCCTTDSSSVSSPHTPHTQLTAALSRRSECCECCLPLRQVRVSEEIVFDFGLVLLLSIEPRSTQRAATTTVSVAPLAILAAKDPNERKYVDPRQ